MFRADIRGMAEAADDMQRQIRKLNQEIGEMENVINGLAGLSGMDGVRRSLRKQIDNMDTQRRQLLKMMTALQQIVRSYSTCERGIIDYAEDNRRRRRQSFEWVHFSPGAGLSEMLKQIVY